MDNRLLAQGMLLGLKSFGLEINKWEDDIVYISVPKDTTDIEPNNNSVALAGKKLADIVQTKFINIGCKDLKIKYRIRDEVWSKEKTNFILSKK